MSASEALPPGIYEALLSEELRGLLDAHPELRPVFGKIDDESSAHTYSQFVWQVLLTAPTDSGLDRESQFYQPSCHAFN